MVENAVTRRIAEIKADARRQALEEAARIVEARIDSVSMSQQFQPIADQIRALAEQLATSTDAPEGDDANM